MFKIRKYAPNPEFCAMQLHTTGLIFIKDRKLLLAFSNNKQCYYLPGGKIDPGETAIDSLRREAEEELSVSLKAEDLIYYTHVTAPAFGEVSGVIMEQECFLSLSELDPQPTGEIGGLAYFTLNEYLLQPHIAPGTVTVLEQLTVEGRIEY